MIKVITYGTYDLLHHGHIKLLERAKALGDYLIVGVTADDFDKTRGKINVQQSLIERIEAVKATGLADEIIIEEYEGQKIDDIKKYDVDIFTVGSDWTGQFDYLNEYCEVVYLERTKGISSSELREEKRAIHLGLVGNSAFLNKVNDESEYVNGLQITSLCTDNLEVMNDHLKNIDFITNDYSKLLANVDAVYIRSLPNEHYDQIKQALNMGKHVLCESPLTLDEQQNKELFEIAKSKNLILMEAIKTAYATAYRRLLLLVKSGKIGDVISVDATCTSLQSRNNDWPGIYEWGPTALLPVLQILGTDCREFKIISHINRETNRDSFTKIDFLYDHSVASIKVGDGVKSEGELIVSGTKAYVYVPAPWWKTDYFEIRYENQNDNKRYFYQLDGEGIRHELVSFIKSIENNRYLGNIDKQISYNISMIISTHENESLIKKI
ncbi:glycerol-3-phosphate cytidylyltransferase [Coprobacillus sp. TM10-10]|uniref:adenylyltransferase/cytidyltransferase family protein n=1 Tax=Faecalibacillus intestinalis TaxID=1982626 RepID=UPI000E4A6683|nr:adenylyltransferase/cytidyltransferase family protein [Faecalibacillus intestinalis]RGI03348.1 glycerol-3-phosphate cytidylyltransferase [Coprobacillus sp. TM10-10]